MQRQILPGFINSTLAVSLLVSGCASAVSTQQVADPTSGLEHTAPSNTSQPSVVVPPTATEEQLPFPTSIQRGTRPKITPEVMVSDKLLSGAVLRGDNLDGNTALEDLIQNLQLLLRETASVEIEPSSIRVFQAPDRKTATLLASMIDGNGIYWLTNGQPVANRYSADPYAPSFPGAGAIPVLRYETLFLPEGVISSDLRVGWLKGESGDYWPVVCYWKKAQYRVFDIETGSFIEARPVRGDFIYEGERTYDSGTHVTLWVEQGGFFDGTIGLGGTMERDYHESLKRNMGYETVEAMFEDARANNGIVDVRYPRPTQDKTMIEWTEPTPTNIFELNIQMADDAGAKAHFPETYQQLLRWGQSGFLGIVTDQSLPTMQVAPRIYEENGLMANTTTPGWVFKSLTLDRSDPTAWYYLFNPRRGGGGMYNAPKGAINTSFDLPFIAADNKNNP